MLNSISAEETCQEVLQTLRSSSLTFFVQETAYSAYITIRKRYRKEALKTAVPCQSTEIKALNNLKLAHDNLVNYCDDLKDKFEESVTECEELQTKVTENEAVIANLHQKLTEAEAEVQGMHILKSRNEKLEAEKKTIKTDKDELLRENNAANVALKSCRKDLKDSAHRFNKKIEELEVKIEELTEFKIMKNSEEKGIRNMKKKKEKKLKEVREKEAKLKLDQSSLEKQLKHLTNDTKNTDDNENLRGDTGEHLEISIERVSANQPNPYVQGSKSSPSLAIPTLVPHHHHLDLVEDPPCEHDP